MNKEKETYIEKLKAQLEEWNDKATLLEAKSDKVESRAQIEYGRQIDLLFAKLGLLQDNLIKLQQADDQAWQKHTTNVEKLWQEVQGSFDSAVSKLL